MKIGNPVDLYRAGAPSGGAAPTETDKAKNTLASPSSLPASEGSATVTLSGELGALKADAKVDGAFDAKRVEQLKAAIADGSFKVNAEVVAEKMISGNLGALTGTKP